MPMCNIFLASLLNSSSCCWCSSQQVSGNGQQSGEPVGRVHIVFNHVESKVVETAESPNGDEQKEADLQRRTLEQNQAARQETQQQEQATFCFDQGRAR